MFYINVLQSLSYKVNAVSLHSILFIPSVKLLHIKASLYNSNHCRAKGKDLAVLTTVKENRPCPTPKRKRDPASTPMERFCRRSLNVSMLCKQTWCEMQAVYSLELPLVAKREVERPEVKAGASVHLARGKHLTHDLLFTGLILLLFFFVAFHFKCTASLMTLFTAFSKTRCFLGGWVVVRISGVVPSRDGDITHQSL